ncbi:hypothetical protein N7495_006304 [Penicillium taxi]|uniref:uncharacterized protein n=1 Tax=Penicillium taxi TaxID=168475 RepID=UPI00254510CD|nr:uncharacterized protein N7495_006304 [Penicillium taxi]KAJ5894613.1 hypothetical protein N7495_006304 [Penicillium taxi]
MSEIAPLMRLRIIVLWIQGSPQRRQIWYSTCIRLGLPTKFIEYDVETRWNSTNRMLDDALESKLQLQDFIKFETPFFMFLEEDWIWLSHLHHVLAKLDRFTAFVSKRQPHISFTVPVYYGLDDLLHNVASRQEGFEGLPRDIAGAVENSIQKYKKYYYYMDATDLYYIALLLDPRIKGSLLKKHLLPNEPEVAMNIIQAIREKLECSYPPATSSDDLIRGQPQPKKQRVDSMEYEDNDIHGLLERAIAAEDADQSEFDRYFDAPQVRDRDSLSNPAWLCDWWGAHKHDFPRLAAAARDYLAIPASEVSVERLFNRGRDVLAIRRHRMSGETMRILMLLDDIGQSH